MKYYFLILLFLLPAASSFGVSRIGGGKISSQKSLFDLEVPTPFSNLEQGQDMVLAMGPRAYTSNQIGPQFIQVREFERNFNSISAEDRPATQKFFADRDWNHLQVSNSCIEAFSYTNATVTGIALTWGQGKGVILEGPATPLVRETIEKSIQTLTLLPGACSWK